MEDRQDADYDEDDPGLQDVIDDFVRKEKLTGESLKAFQYGLAANIMDEYAGSTELLSLWFNEDAGEKGGDPVVLGGFDEMVNYLLKGIPVQRSARVTKVDYSRPSVKVTTSSSKTYTAKRAVIVTVPLGVLKANTIKFTPTLPSRNRKAIAGLGMGLLNKCVLVFDKSFWGTTEEWIERISTTGFQSTLSMMPVADQPILYGFNSAENARRVEAWSDAKTCDTLMSHMRTIWPNAPKYTSCVVTRWGKDPYSRGSYSYTSKRMEYDPAHSGVGAPVSGGRLSFAGEATSMTHPGTVNGAFISTDVRPHAPTPSLALRASFVRQAPTRPASRPPKSSSPPNLTTTTKTTTKTTTTTTRRQTSKSSRDTTINTCIKMRFFYAFRDYTIGRSSRHQHSTALQVLLQHGKPLGLLTIVGHHGARAPHDLPGLALLVDLAEPGPLTQLLVLRHGDQVDALLGTERLDQLLVVRLVAVVREHTQLRLPTLNRTRRLVKSTRQSIVRKGLLQHHLDGRVDVHRSLCRRGRGRSLLHRLGRIPSVRHCSVLDLAFGSLPVCLSSSRYPASTRDEENASDS